MFWKSALLGLQTLADWHIWVAGLGLVVVFYIWRSVETSIGRKVSGKREALAAVLALDFGRFVVQAIASSFFVAVCLPSILTAVSERMTNQISEEQISDPSWPGRPYGRTDLRHGRNLPSENCFVGLQDSP
jgi:hypothetical protein